MKHWASTYIGKKWVSGARGPTTFDCWGLLYWVYQKHYNTTVPVYPGVQAEISEQATGAFASALTSEDWVQIDVPVDGCAVVMGSNQIASHVGLYLDVDGGVILHCKLVMGVMCQKAVTITNHGVNILGYYIPRTWPTSS